MCIAGLFLQGVCYVNVYYLRYFFCFDLFSKILTEFLVVFFVTEKKLPYVVTHDVCPSVRPSSVEITLERGFDRSAELIDLKIGLNIGN